MTRTLLLVLLFYLYLHVKSEKKLPSYLNICKRYDPEISKCWRNTLEKLKPYLVKGIPEFKVPPTEPFYIESLRLNQTSSRSIQFVADLVNLTFSGGTDFDVVYAHVDYKNNLVELGLKFPHLVMNGQYKAKGRVLLFEFDGWGEVEGDFKEITANGTYFLETVKKNGTDYVRIKESQHDVELKSIYVYMHDLFRNNPEITKNVNKAINDNIDLLYSDFKPLLVTTIGTMLTEYSNRAYAQYPFDVLLPIN